MHAVMEALVQLQKLEFESPSRSAAAKEMIAKLRAEVPLQVLGHYDRLLARGKKGVALVRNHVCTECHMGVPIGTVVTIMKGADIQLCGHCGRYLYVLPEAAASTPAPAQDLKTKRAPRKRAAESRPASPKS